jgi:glycosyltransferase involved in cell wall biosynthesis
MSVGRDAPLSTGRVRVLFVINALKKNGAVLSTLTTIRQLDRRRFAPTLFVMRRPAHAGGPQSIWPELFRDLPIIYGSLGGHTHEVYSSGRNTLRVLFTLLRSARGHDLIVGGLEVSATFLAVVAAKCGGKASVGFVRNSLPDVLKWLPPRFSGWTRRLYPQLDLVVTLSHGLQRSTEAFVPALVGRVRTIPVPLDLSAIRRRALEPLPELERPPYLLAVGRIDDQKGFDVLLKAYSQARALGVRQQLVILGEGPRVKEQRIRALIARLGLDDHVTLMGFQPNPYAWMRRADAFISSSRYEGFSRVIAEALAVGAPVVATDCPSGPAEILEGGRYGVLVPNEDDEALGRAVHGLLSDDAAWQELRKRGALRAEDFHQDVSVRAVEAAFLSVLRPRGSCTPGAPATEAAARHHLGTAEAKRAYNPLEADPSAVETAKPKPPYKPETYEP